jgi:hypothetical protein
MGKQMSEEVTEPTNDEAVDTNPETNDSGEPEVFDKAYVEKLRRENAAKRKEKEEVEAKFRTKIRDMLIKQEAGQILADPNDLLLHNPDLNIWNEEGEANAEIIREAAHALRIAKPHLAARQFGQDVGAGNRGEDKKHVRDFSDMLGMFK